MLLDSLIPLGRLITPWQLLVGTCLVVVAEETVAENQDFQRVCTSENRRAKSTSKFLGM